MKASELTKSSIVDIGGVPHRVEALQVQTPSARGGASLYKVRFRNVQSGQKVDQTLRGDDALQEAHFETRDVQYLFKNGDQYTFMDLTSYEQFELPAAEIENAIPYLIEDMEDIRALVSEERVLGVVMPDTVELRIVECDPSMKGASATARTKPATLETGLVVQVPEYIAPDETIRVDTRTNAFLNRV
jgi:elongation factor P